MNRPVAAIVGIALVAAVAAGCSGTSSDGAAPAATPTATTTTPVPTDTGLPTPLASSGLSAADVSDPGLPSKVGGGKLSNATIKRLVQYFEDKVAKAYADGDADALEHYLAGPMLSGNRATIMLLAKQDKLNVFRIRVKTIKPQTNDGQHIIVDMTGDMVLDYFVDSKTHKVLDNGLPGPSQLQLAIFLDHNPKTDTWYWTGEQSETTGGATGSTSGGQ